MATAPMPTPTRPTVEAVVSEASVNPRSPVFESVGMTAPRTTRSKPSRATASQHSRTGQKLSLAVLVGGAAVRGLAMVVLLVREVPRPCQRSLGAATDRFHWAEAPQGPRA